MVYKEVSLGIWVVCWGIGILECWEGCVVFVIFGVCLIFRKCLGSVVGWVVVMLVWCDEVGDGRGEFKGMG